MITRRNAEEGVSSQRLGRKGREGLAGIDDKLHSPKLVLEYLRENREPLLKQTLEVVLNGLG
jgi:hypothetical protein